ncbi:MAG TPA: hypothetical protein VFY04_08720 [Solirubrobacterales bacterium]|nr:hypothetical protein [Solirubrobacterales bacterium]
MRNLKALGLAFVAMLAMSAMAASAAQASAEPKFTAAEYPATLDATGDEFEKFTAFGGEVTCKHSEFHSELTGPSNELTVTPTYNDCHALGIGSVGVLSATVTHNGCKYRFYNPKTHGSSLQTSPSETHHYYTLSTDVDCPTGKQIEVHIYPSLLHTGSICTLTVGSQTGLIGATADVHTKAGADDVTLTGTVNNIRSEMHRFSSACPESGTTVITNSATYHIPSDGVTAQGTNEVEEFIDADIG